MRESTLDIGLRTLRLAVDTHVITAHFALPLLIRRPGGLVVARSNGQSLSSGGLARVYGFTDTAGSQPDAWRYVPEVQDAGRPADTRGYG